MDAKKTGILSIWEPNAHAFRCSVALTSFSVHTLIKFPFLPAKKSQPRGRRGSGSGDDWDDRREGGERGDRGEGRAEGRREEMNGGSGREGRGGNRKGSDEEEGERDGERVRGQAAQRRRGGRQVIDDDDEEEDGEGDGGEGGRRRGGFVGRQGGMEDEEEEEFEERQEERDRSPRSPKHRHSPRSPRGTGTGRHRDSEGSGGEGEEGGGGGRKVRQQVTERDLFGESSEEEEEEEGGDGGERGRAQRKASRSPQGTPLASPVSFSSSCLAGGGDGRKVRQQVTERDLFGESSEDEEEEGGDAGRKQRKASRSPQGTPLASPQCMLLLRLHLPLDFSAPAIQASPPLSSSFLLPPLVSLSSGMGMSRRRSRGTRRAAMTSFETSQKPSPTFPLLFPLPSSPHLNQQRHGYESEEEEQRHERGGYDEEGRWDEEGGERRRARERPKGPPLDLDLSLFDPPAPPDKMVMVMASNIVGIQAAPFDPDTYEEGGPQNLIRWRHVRRPDGTMGVESNARMVRWSDGSLHLLLGAEVLATDIKSMQHDKAHLFVRHPKQGVVQGQGQLVEKMRFRPFDTHSLIHKKLTLGLDSKYRKGKELKSIVTTGDPEKEKEERERSIQQQIRTKETLRQEQEKRARKYSNQPQQRTARDREQQRYGGGYRQQRSPSHDHRPAKAAKTSGRGGRYSDEEDSEGERGRGGYDEGRGGRGRRLEESDDEGYGQRGGDRGRGGGEEQGGDEEDWMEERGESKKAAAWRRKRVVESDEDE
ncbi:unnamed protein product [Closterium sp. Naga37s-1]|nr:unnamed protein product [Closterium sp. Naga37s-1]